MQDTPRVAYAALAPAAYKALRDLSAALYGGALDRVLVDLVFLRVSQVNGCAYCIDLHWRDLIAQSADPRKLNALSAWQEMPFFSERERAALNWAEIVTRTAGRDATDEEFARLRAHFSETEIAELTFTVAAMNAWNRMAISMRQPVKA